MARDRTEAAQAPSAWMTRPRIRTGKCVGEGTKDAARGKDCKTAQHQPFAAEAIGERSDQKLPERERNEEAAQRQAEFLRRNAEAGANPRKGRKDDVGGKCAERSQSGEQEQDSPISRRSEGAGFIESATASSDTGTVALRASLGTSIVIGAAPVGHRRQTTSSARFGGRLQELLRQPLVVDRAREDHRTDHCRENGHGLAAGLLAVGLANPTAEHFEVFPDPGFE